MAWIGSGLRDRRSSPSVGDTMQGDSSQAVTPFDGPGAASAGRVCRRSDVRRLRDLPDYLLTDIGLATREATARFRRP